jgi:peptidoglycan/xylan/chitin deacetylase (PgdA/CDA1 family)
MYHSIAPYEQDPYGITVRPERFEQQLTWLRRLGYRGVSVGELLAAVRQGSARGLVGLSFDDGYADFVEHALPALQRHRFTATAYVLGGRLGGGNVWDPDGPRKALLTADQVREMAAAGVEIGSHGLRHVSLPATDAVELVREIRDSRHILQDLTGQDVSGFCYPWGHVDSRAVGIVQDAGYAYACAIERSELTGPHALPRVFIADWHTPRQLMNTVGRHWVRWQYRGPGWRLVHGSCTPEAHVVCLLPAC